MFWQFNDWLNERGHQTLHSRSWFSSLDLLTEKLQYKEVSNLLGPQIIGLCALRCLRGLCLVTQFFKLGHCARSAMIICFIHRQNREIHRSWSSTVPMMCISLTEEIDILSPWAGHSYAGAFLTFSLLPRVSDRPIARSLNLWPHASGCGGNNGLLKPATVPPIPDSRLYCSSTSSLSTSSSSVSASFCASYSASSEGAEVIEVGGCGGSRRRRHGDFEGVTGVSWLMVLGGIGVGILDDWRVLISRLRTADSDDIMLAEPGSKNFRHHQSQDLINTLFQRHRSRIKDRIVHP